MAFSNPSFSRFCRTILFLDVLFLSAIDSLVKKEKKKRKEMGGRRKELTPNPSATRKYIAANLDVCNKNLSL